MAAPTAAQAPGSETRIARRASKPRERLGDSARRRSRRRGRTRPIVVSASQEPWSPAGSGRRATSVLDPVDDPAELGERR